MAVRLRMLGTTDLHVNILSYDYYRDAPDVSVGLARTARLIAAARAQAPNSLLFDNGDTLQGTPLGDDAAAQLAQDPTVVHPMIAVMNRLRYDAASLGNHEFNYGLDVLDAALKDAAFPVLSCNILRPDGAPRFTPWTILARDCVDEAGATVRLNIGVVGFTTPKIMQWDMSHLVGRVTTAGIAETAERVIPALRRAGADIVIALCHAGVAKGPSRDDPENAATALAEVGGIDAIFAGHQHLLLPGADFIGAPGVDAAAGTLAGVPACMAGFFGNHLGVIDLRLETTGAGWRATSFHIENRPIATALIDEDPEIVALIEPAHAATLAHVRSPVGELKAPARSFFALLADDPSVQIVNAAQRWHIEALKPSEPALNGLPLIVSAAPFKCGGRGGPGNYTDVPAGPIALKHVADLYVFPNSLRVVKVTGSGLREWLERAASVLNRIDPNEAKPQPLIDASTVSYDFDTLDGVSYEIDVTQSARYDDKGALINAGARRIVDLRFGGEPIDDQAEFLIAASSYRAGGGGSFPGCDGRNIVYESPEALRDILARYIAAMSPIEPRRPPGWRLAPWPAGLTVTYPTAPAAAAEPAPAGLKLTPLGLNAAGFLNLRVEFAG